MQDPPVNRHPRRRTRPPAERERVVRVLRRRIVSGALRPGSRLPARSRLIGSMKVSTVTLQAALDELRHDGFIRTAVGRGTYISDHPPHRDRFALVLPFHPDADRERYSHFWRVLTHAADRFNERGERRLEVFYGLGHGPESAEHRSLIEDVQRRCIAGLIFATPPYRLMDSPLVTTSDVPRVAIMDRPAPGVAGIPRVYPHVRTFLDRAVAHLASRGRRRIALVTVPRPAGFFRHYHQRLREHRLATQRFWTQVLDPWTGRGVGQATGLLMSVADRPDGLIVADDNLLPQVTAGLVAAGVNVPGDIEVIAYTNFPLPTRAAVPVCRVGFDANLLLARCLRVLDQLRLGRRAPGVSLLKASLDPTVLAVSTAVGTSN